MLTARFFIVSRHRARGGGDALSMFSMVYVGWPS